MLFDPADPAVVLQKLEQFPVRELSHHAEVVPRLERVEHRDDPGVAQPPQDVDLGAQSCEVPRGLAGLGDALDGDEGARVFSAGLVDLDGAGWSWGGGRAPVERAKTREEGEGRRREAEEVEKKEERWRGIGA